MIKEALEYIVNLAAPHLEFRNGSHYADRVLHRIPNELTASPLAVHTLSAVRDYIESGADECAEDEDSLSRRFVIHVADYNEVYLYAVCIVAAVAELQMRSRKARCICTAS